MIPYPYFSDYDPDEFIPYRYNNVVEGVFGVYITDSCDSDCMSCILEAGQTLMGLSIYTAADGGSCDQVGSANIEAAIGLGGNWMAVTPVITIDPTVRILSTRAPLYLIVST